MTTFPEAYIHDYFSQCIRFSNFSYYIWFCRYTYWCL